MSDASTVVVLAGDRNTPSRSRGMAAWRQRLLQPRWLTPLTVTALLALW